MARTSSRPGALRPWTRLAVAAGAGHVAYELVAGVGVPLASRVGPVVAGAGHAVSAVAGYRAAGHLPGPRGDRVSAVANGFLAAAVLAHFTSWPRTTRAGLPWLTECEGLRGPVIAPYNVILQVSAVAAVGGFWECRRAWPWAAVTTAACLPALRGQMPVEYGRLLAQARRRPGWWNRRLAQRAGGAPGT